MRKTRAEWIKGGKFAAPAQFPALSAKSRPDGMTAGIPLGPTILRRSTRFAGPSHCPLVRIDDFSMTGVTKILVAMSVGGGL
jgi:hypothetical protein